MKYYIGEKEYIPERDSFYKSSEHRFFLNEDLMFSIRSHACSKDYLNMMSKGISPIKSFFFCKVVLHRIDKNLPKPIFIHTSAYTKKHGNPSPPSEDVTHLKEILGLSIYVKETKSGIIASDESSFSRYGKVVSSTSKIKKLRGLIP